MLSVLSVLSVFGCVALLVAAVGSQAIVSSEGAMKRLKAEAPTRRECLSWGDPTTLQLPSVPPGVRNCGSSSQCGTARRLGRSRPLPPKARLANWTMEKRAVHL